MEESRIEGEIVVNRWYSSTDEEDLLPEEALGENELLPEEVVPDLDKLSPEKIVPDLNELLPEGEGEF